MCAKKHKVKLGQPRWSFVEYAPGAVVPPPRTGHTCVTYGDCLYMSVSFLLFSLSLFFFSPVSKMAEKEVPPVLLKIWRYGRSVPLQRHVVVRPLDAAVDRTVVHRVHPRPARGTRRDLGRRRHVRLWRSRRRRQRSRGSRRVQNRQYVLSPSHLPLSLSRGRARDSETLFFLLTAQRWFMFQNMGPAPSGRSGHAMATWQNKVLVLGGESYTSMRSDDPSLVHTLDTSKPNLPSFRFHSSRCTRLTDPPSLCSENQIPSRFSPTSSSSSWSTIFPFASSCAGRAWRCCEPTNDFALVSERRRRRRRSKIFDSGPSRVVVDSRRPVATTCRESDWFASGRRTSWSQE